MDATGSAVSWHLSVPHRAALLRRTWWLLLFSMRHASLLLPNQKFTALNCPRWLPQGSVLAACCGPCWKGRESSGKLHYPGQNGYLPAPLQAVRGCPPPSSMYAVSLFLSWTAYQGNIEEAISMYRGLHKWHDAIAVVFFNDSFALTHFLGVH